MVVDERGKFREDNFQKSLAALQPAAESTGSASKKKMKSMFICLLLVYNDVMTPYLFYQTQTIYTEL